MRYNLVYIIFLCICFASYSKTLAQCPNFTFTFDQEHCVNSPISISNSSSASLGFTWDFSLGDFDSIPDSFSLGTYTQLSRTDALSSVKYKNNLFAFAPIYSTASPTKLYRLDFGDSFKNTPTVVDLGNPGNLISTIYDMKFVYDGGIWYALLLKSNGNLILLKFPDGLDQNNIIATDLGNVTSNNNAFGLDVVKYNSEVYAYVTTRGEKSLRVIRFQSGIENSFSIDKVDLPNSGVIAGVSVYNDCDNTIALVSSANSLKLFKVTFDNADLFDMTLAKVDEITFSYTDAVRLWHVRQGQGLKYICLTKGAKLIEIDFGKNFYDNPSPDILLKTTFEGWDNLNGQSMLVNNSLISILGLNFSTSELFLGEYPNESSASVKGTQDYSPILSYSGDGWKYFQVMTLDSTSGNKTYYYDSLRIYPLPDVQFEVDKACNVESTEFYDLSTTSNGSITEWAWDFDGLSSSMVQNPTNFFPTPNLYDVSLSVKDSKGCESLLIEEVKIYDTADLQPDFTFPSTICSNAVTEFIDASTASEDLSTSFLWDFGGQMTSEDSTPSVVFENSGDFLVTLTVSGVSGCSKSISKNIAVIGGTLPQFSFDDSCVGDEVVFTNSTSGDITHVNWEFSNGFTSTLSSPTMVFDTEGTYEATLNITNADGCETFDTRTITIHALPVVDFGNELACEVLSTQFEDLSTVNIDNLSSWRWDFGDGSVASEDQNASHIFNSNGDFEVELTATSSFGCVDSLTKTVTVLKAPEVAFDFDKICLDVPIQFTDASVAVEGEEITDWSWNLGGTFSAQQNPQTTFENPLDYSVSLTVTSSNLCTATQTQLISIPETPTLDFSLVDDCENETAQITDITVMAGDNISNRSWSINDSPVSSEPNFTYDFAQAGNYNVTLSVSTENGCEYETIRAVTIHPAPTANFVTSFDFGAPPFVVDFTNQSSGAQTYSWEFEEGATSEEVNPSHTFNNLGEFDISLVAISDQNCTDTASRRIQVLEPLLDAEVINFNILPTATGDKLSFAIRNNGTIRLDSLYVTVNLGGELEIYETINKAMNPNEVISAQLDLTIDNKRLDYICIDVMPFISNYQDVDEDNNRSCITFGQETFIMSNPYPNPSTSLVAFDIIATKDAIADIELLSADGDLINTFSAQVYQGNNRLDFDLNQLKSGLYFLKVKLDGQIKVHRLVINN
ncbi:PKD domain-containing protein [Fulvivirga sp.]|uniref:PKD domain-containing protein n=1 Tax=Fulvivirga sp. TaxID=1931237 RepID=UPI0032EEC8EE